ncbi:MAG: hypothetical protein JWP48_5477 [Actinoallomurus sp.]|jgi:hypothetical protein|nr:hypothetical protein [Actinoallomurus sp.]
MAGYRSAGCGRGGKDDHPGHESEKFQAMMPMTDSP